MYRTKRRFKRASGYQRAKRPIDKSIVQFAFNHATPNTVQQQFKIYPLGAGGATFPGTITGLRWSIQAQPGVLNALNSNSTYYVIVRVRENTAVQPINIAGPTPDTATGGSLYNPEQDVMAAGCLQWGQGTTSVNVTEGDIGTTKTMRKLMTGDSIHLAVRSVFNVPCVVIGFVEYFYKT